MKLNEQEISMIDKLFDDMKKKAKEYCEKHKDEKNVLEWDGRSFSFHWYEDGKKYGSLDRPFFPCGEPSYSDSTFQMR